MTIRTSTGLVESTLQGDYDSETSPSLARPMTTANILTNRLVTCASRKGISVDVDTLREIETQLACHFYTLVDRIASEEKTADASIKYQGKTGMRLDYTPYGQTAMLLDPSGCLSSFNSPRQASIDWLGKDPSQKIDWVDRI